MHALSTPSLRDGRKDRQDVTEDEIQRWVSRQMAGAPERDEAWGESVMRGYLGTDDKAAA